MSGRLTVRVHKKPSKTPVSRRSSPIKVPDILCVIVLHIKAKRRRRRRRL